MKRLKRSHPFAAAALALTIGSCGAARAGAPQPEQRESDFAHVCAGGVARGQSCAVATQADDCPGSQCILKPESSFIRGEVTVIAHDTVTDWATGNVGNRALTVMLEVKGPDGKPRMLASTYQNLTFPTDAPTAPGNVVAIAMDEAAVKTLATSVGGLLFTRPEATFTQQLQALFGSTGTPALVAIIGRQPESTDQTATGLATVLRFKVRLQFLAPAA